MTRRRNIAVTALAGWLAVAALTAGCQWPTKPEPRPIDIRSDPCAERLHDLCGQVLLYLAGHRTLPPTMNDLAASQSLPLPPLVCPMSGKAYVYDPKGRALRGRTGRLVLYDPEPSHQGFRWGILVRTDPKTGTISARVIAVLEEQLAPLEPPASAPAEK